MSDFDAYSARLGEYAVQAIIEQIEKIEGVKEIAVEPLASRWVRLMHPTEAHYQAA